MVDKLEDTLGKIYSKYAIKSDVTLTNLMSQNRLNVTSCDTIVTSMMSHLENPYFPRCLI